MNNTHFIKKIAEILKNHYAETGAGVVYYNNALSDLMRDRDHSEEWKGKGRIPLRKSLQNFMFAKIAPSRLLRVTMYEEKYYGRVVPRSQADSFGKRYQSYGSDRGYDHSRYKP